MKTIFYIHWNKKELQQHIKPLIDAGYKVSGESISGDRIKFTEGLPDVFVISLDRLPSHGKAVAEWIWAAKKRRHIPIIFEGGKEDKVAAIKEKFPKAIFVKTGKVLDGLIS